MPNAWLVVAAAASVTVTVNGDVPDVAGVPVMAPVVASGVEYAAPNMPPGNGEAVVIVTAGGPAGTASDASVGR
jgi:hypothetical protein